MSDDDALAILRLFVWREWDTCRNLIQKLTPEVLERCQREFYLLHEACYNDAPLDIVRALHAVDPEAVVRRERTVGQLPLHKVCYGGSEETMAFLLGVAPRAADVADDDGQLPIHRVLAQRISPSLVRRLLSVHPTAVYARDRYGRSPLDEFALKWYEDLRFFSSSNDDGSFDGLPRGHERDGGLDGVDVVRETLVLLVRAFVRKSVEEEEHSANNARFPVHEVTRFDRAFLLSIFRLFFVRTTPREQCATPTEERDFLLHLECARRPYSEDEWDDDVDTEDDASTSVESDT